jgi:hypothetical protein
MSKVKVKAPAFFERISFASSPRVGMLKSP